MNGEHIKYYGLNKIKISIKFKIKRLIMLIINENHIKCCLIFVYKNLLPYNKLIKYYY